MKRLAIPAALVAAFLATGCTETEQVCRRSGNQITCREELAPSASESKARLERASRYLDDLRE